MISQTLLRHIPEIITQTAHAARTEVLAWITRGISSHSTSKLIELEKMKIKILPALSDNYMYLLIDKDTQKAAVVDPVQPDTVIKAVNEENVELTHVLTTHHHYDHAGGNKNLVAKKPGLTVLGGDDRIDALTTKVKHGDKFNIGKLNVECLFTPCHTNGHICYYVTSEGETPAVFTGDTLFIGGCGRFFEGTPDQMYKALIETLGVLPDNTRVFCGHEYTVRNLQFAKTVEPSNKDIDEYYELATKKAEKKEPTVPSTIGTEKLINPFMRVHSDSVQKYAGSSDVIATMGFIRKAKDKF